MKRIFVILTVLLVAFSLVTYSRVTASNGTNQLSNNQKSCTGTWKFPMLYVGGKDGVVFAQAIYDFDDNCQPVLVNETRLPYVPDSVTHPSQQPIGSITVVLP